MSIVKDNVLKRNIDKSHLLISSNDPTSMKISGFEVKNSDCKILLGVKFNHKFNIHSRISYLCKKASCKINPHRRVAPFAMDVFFKSQLSYCSLVWMCHILTNDKNMNKFNKGYFRSIYNDQSSSFDNDGSVSTKYRNLHVVSTEMFKI